MVENKAADAQIKEEVMEVTNDQNVDTVISDPARLGNIHSALMTPNPIKRKNPSGRGPPQKKARTEPILHTPLSMLNQLVKGISFNLIGTSGPPHCPIFEMSTEVKGQTFTGTGIGKQQAKQNAAQKVLNSLFPAVLEKYNQSIQNSMDQKSESNGNQCIPDPDSSASDSPMESAVAPSVDPATRLPLDKQGKLRKKALDALAGKVNPLAVLNEILPNVEFSVVNENSLGCLSKFIFHLTAEGRTFKGSGPSKKSAKTAAARAYFNYKFGEDPEAVNIISNNETLPQDITPPYKFPLLSPTLADSIADMILVKYDELMVNMKDYARRKILAGICMSRNEDMTDLQVISIATGTKTVGGEYISVSGSALNDSHAEVATRRGLMRYLYSQLRLAHIKEEKDKSQCIFQYVPGIGFKLKDGIKFHLYITSSPCGDARIFSPHEVLKDEMLDRHPNRHSRGQLRTKIESGEGTIPVKPDSIQTWDGVMQGNRLLTMSCSDKVLRWNILGLQGNLLSHFIAPIYVHSVVISNLYNEPHMYRALRGRVESFLDPNELPEPYKFVRPYANKTTSPEPRIPGKAPNHSVNWNIVDNSVEVVTMMTGRTIENSISRLSKASLGNEFVKLLKLQVPSLTNVNINDFETYGDAKHIAKKYEAAKEIFYGLFIKAGLGSWVRKPYEQNHFEVNKNV